ncbi:hypothetical protein BKA00_004055 [Actinomadura coerulea]|uniref:Uncharacterized protein n=1 Tax=Actinomadura coerulea TaxID=46159 RepID=A0A7X0L030_9ACTN|nr:hypothetical protein [Actinomadura coerulea]MBB6397141.1 hypothetical protein [Actinomadura coerulea]GGP96832.1 hypothetical protein GCM10010187_10820 [Actinomadura coerulea]
MKYAVLLPGAAGVTADPAWIGEYARFVRADDQGWTNRPHRA